ncbi:MAG: hypothetical protein ACP5TL_01575 [Candidatus Micrarchaeia archaeon]
MPAKSKEIKKMKAASPPKDYNMEGDTVYTSYEGLKASAVLGSLKSSHVALRLLVELPEAILITFLFYYFVAVLPHMVPFEIVFAASILIVFYILDIIFGGLIGLAKALPFKKKGNINFLKMVNISISSFESFIYIFFALSLFFLKTSHNIIALLLFFVAFIVYITTIRFGFSPYLAVVKERRSKSEALELSSQYFGGSFMAMLSLNTLTAIVPAITLLYLILSGTIFAFAAMFVSILIFGVIWVLELDASFVQFEKIKKVNYNIN